MRRSAVLIGFERMFGMIPPPVFIAVHCGEITEIVRCCCSRLFTRLYTKMPRLSFAKRGYDVVRKATFISIYCGVPL